MSDALRAPAGLDPVDPIDAKDRLLPIEGYGIDYIRDGERLSRRTNLFFSLLGGSLIGWFPVAFGLVRER